MHRDFAKALSLQGKTERIDLAVVVVFFFLTWLLLEAREFNKKPARD